MEKEIERRNKISMALKKAHNEGRHPGWRHKNQDLLRSSYPEKWFRKVLSEDLRFNDLLVIEQHRVWKYYLDFAFVEFMVDLEIDGIQHRRQHQQQKDVERDDYLNSVGWCVYRIEWSKLQTDTQKCIDDFKVFLETKQKDLKTFIVAERKPVKMTGEEKRRVIAENRMKAIREANIDFSRYGWVKQVSEIIKIKPQKVHIWMQRYFPDMLKSAFTRVS